MFKCTGIGIEIWYRYHEKSLVSKWYRIEMKKLVSPITTVQAKAIVKFPKLQKTYTIVPEENKLDCKCLSRFGHKCLSRFDITKEQRRLGWKCHTEISSPIMGFQIIHTRYYIYKLHKH